jgi:uncharacterized protein (DUF433 family)
MNATQDRISIDPNILNGKPAIRGKRIAVQTVLEFLSSGDGIDELLEQYPSLEREDIYACLQFASSMMQNHYQIEPVAA